MFEPFPKIARLRRGCVITEKIDGTNAQVYITDDGQVHAASRTRMITPENDNFGFARWVEGNKAELLKLGPGRHFGEWWGQGIQRGYGLKEKRFSLFNHHRWKDERPECCYVVPLLYEGLFLEGWINGTVLKLSAEGSSAAPGFMKPEGVVVWHEAARQMFKITCENDEAPKGRVA